MRHCNSLPVCLMAFSECSFVSIHHHSALFSIIYIIDFTVPGTWIRFKHYCFLYHCHLSARYFTYVLFFTGTVNSLCLTFLWLYLFSPLLLVPFFITNTWVWILLIGVDLVICFFASFRESGEICMSESCKILTDKWIRLLQNLKHSNLSEENKERCLF